MELVVIQLIAGLVLVGLVAWAAKRPYHGLRALLVLLPLHSGMVLLLSNVLQIDSRLLILASAWKEAVIGGLVIAAALVARGRWRQLRLVHWLAVALLVLIAVRVGIDLVAARTSSIAVLFGARQLGEFLVLLLAVAILRPSVPWFLGTARLVLPVMVVSATFALAQPLLGAGFYDRFFHAPGEQLHHSYLVNIGELRRFRAAGTFIAPNEFGLGLVIYGSIFVVPLLATVRRWRLVAAAAMLLVIALLLSYSRSAWVGAFVGLVATLLLARRSLLRLWRQGLLVRMPARELVVGLASAAAGAAAVFVLVGGLTLAANTVSGSESSAAGRGASLGRGVAESFDNPGGLGLGTAGPRALEITGSAVLTENWYLLYSIQLGLVALLVLGAFAGATLVDTLSAARRSAAELGPGDAPSWLLERYRMIVMLGTAAALVAALVGALVIPALLDLPASLALWTSVAIVIGWADDARLRRHGAAKPS